MARWQDAYINSNLEVHLRNTQTLLKKSSFKHIQKPHDEELRRVKTFVGVAAAAIKKIDPIIAPNNHVNALASIFSQIHTHLVNYNNSTDPSHLQQAANQIDNGIGNLQHIRLMVTDEPIVSSITLQRLLKKVTDNVGLMTKNRREYTLKISNLKKQITTQEKKIKQLDAVAIRKVKALEKQILTFEKQFSIQQGHIKKEFQAGQRDRISTFTKYFSGFKNTSSSEKLKIFSQLKKDVQSKRVETISQLDELINDSEVKHNELVAIVGLASGDAIRGQHSLAASEEKKSVGIWRRISFGSIAVAAILVSVTTYNSGMSVDTSIMMAPILILLLSAAAYSARLAAGHRREAIRVRQFSLEMEAILPYLDALERSHSDSKDLRNKLAEKFFGNLPPVEANQHQNEAHLSDSMIQKFLDAIKKV